MIKPSPSGSNFKKISFTVLRTFNSSFVGSLTISWIVSSATGFYLRLDLFSRRALFLAAAASLSCSASLFANSSALRFSSNLSFSAFYFLWSISYFFFSNAAFYASVFGYLFGGAFRAHGLSSGFGNRFVTNFGRFSIRFLSLINIW